MCEVLSGISAKTGGGPLAINIYKCVIPIIPYKGMCAHINLCVHIYVCMCISVCVDHERQNGGKLRASSLEGCLNVSN